MSKAEFDALKNLENSVGLLKQNQVEVLLGMVDVSYDYQADMIMQVADIAVKVLGKKQTQDVVTVLDFIGELAFIEWIKCRHQINVGEKDEMFSKMVAAKYIGFAVRKISCILSFPKVKTVWNEKALANKMSIEEKIELIQKIANEIPKDSVDLEVCVAREKLSPDWVDCFSARDVRNKGMTQQEIEKYQDKMQMQARTKDGMLETLQMMLKNDKAYQKFAADMKDVKKSMIKERLEDILSFTNNLDRTAEHAEIVVATITARDAERLKQQRKIEELLIAKREHIINNYSNLVAGCGFENDAQVLQGAQNEIKVDVLANEISNFQNQHKDFEIR